MEDSEQPPELTGRDKAQLKASMLARKRLRESMLDDIFAKLAELNKRLTVDEFEMLDSVAVSRILGEAATSRNTVSRLAALGAVIALPSVAQKLYPGFQFDAARQQVRPIVAEINQQLNAKGDPWGVASWWLNPTAFADDPRSPAELAVTGAREQDLRDMADDLTAD